MYWTNCILAVRIFDIIILVQEKMNIYQLDRTANKKERRLVCVFPLSLSSNEARHQRNVFIIITTVNQYLVFFS